MSNTKELTKSEWREMVESHPLFDGNTNSMTLEELKDYYSGLEDEAYYQEVGE